MFRATRQALGLLGLLCFALLTEERVPAQVAMIQNPTEVTVVNATTVFSQAMQMPQNEIPRSLLGHAQAIAIVPGMMRGAFVLGVQYGRGVLVIRDANGAWQAPRMIQMAGGSIGYQIGVQATDLILVFRTPQSVQNLLKGTLKVGVDASAAAGPVGRQTSAATDVRTVAEILSYSRARGAFVGVSIDGSTISLDPGAEAIYYQPPGSFPASAAQLLQIINAYTVAQAMVAPVAMAGQYAAAPATGWVAAGQHPGDAESTRLQLDQASRQLLAGAGIDEYWKSYLALPAEVYMPNQVPNPQATRQALERYEKVERDPQYAALKIRPEFQQTLDLLRRMSEVRTAANAPATGQLPPPPR
ncbi:MAG: lipid-binding SYLF domain-containing protein [Pirellulales bacterium]|nr:lipid-binding SYLF domain-containing protein [Pirellulales bacterium]